MISYFSEDIEFELNNPVKHSEWIMRIAESEGNSIEDLNYIFCSDSFLHSLNLEYLNHDTLTDIITFDLRDTNTDPVTADIFISIDRVHENAIDQGLEFTDELDRVMIHGLLHLCGYSDKLETDKLNMRKKEDACLSLR
ncbi:rRNA maturation RNase YbeY [Fulvivirga sedimenti]|uniref:Endoribonuclease YbeY n=1 Tax=Fulvivirga sedimenti TaxID=2879465 RepID=A0A9X1HXX1_9BACT|nr:rRNA maturation RNase YbeY [Fulvivirga sedimenti]MCA6078517.1 rRNA maturation RNase YbeY [Fulvivirga sedimenti]